MQNKIWIIIITSIKKIHIIPQTILIIIITALRNQSGIIDIRICLIKIISHSKITENVYNNNQGANFNEHYVGQKYQIPSHSTNGNRQNVDVNNVMNQHSIGLMSDNNTFNSNKTYHNNQKNW